MMALFLWGHFYPLCDPRLNLGFQIPKSKLAQSFEDVRNHYTQIIVKSVIPT